MKKIISMLIIASMLMTMFSFTAQAEGDSENYIVDINGDISFQADRMYYKNDAEDTTNDADSWNAFFDKSSNTLKLNNYNGKAIYIKNNKGSDDKVNIIIELSGNNLITETDDDTEGLEYGIVNETGGNLTIKSEGERPKLEIDMTRSKHEGALYGIISGKYESDNSGSIIIENVDLKINQKSEGSLKGDDGGEAYFYGVVGDNVVINSSNVAWKATMKSEGIQNLATGIRVKDRMILDLQSGSLSLTVEKSDDRSKTINATGLVSDNNGDSDVIELRSGKIISESGKGVIAKISNKEIKLSEGYKQAERGNKVLIGTNEEVEKEVEKLEKEELEKKELQEEQAEKEKQEREQREKEEQAEKEKQEREQREKEEQAEKEKQEREQREKEEQAEKEKQEREQREKEEQAEKEKQEREQREKQEQAEKEKQEREQREKEKQAEKEKQEQEKLNKHSQSQVLSPYIPRNSENEIEGKKETKKENKVEHRKEEVVTNKLFNDVVGDEWYAPAVQFVVEKGWMNGTDTKVFSPNDDTTRSQLVTILYRMENNPDIQLKPTFDDVQVGSYYEKAVVWALNHNVVSGYGENRFGVNDSITREQLATLLYRIAKEKEYNVETASDLSGFSDGNQVSNYAKEAVIWSLEKGLIKGTSENTLSPQGKSTRAQIATILMRFQQNVVK